MLHDQWSSVISIKDKESFSGAARGSRCEIPDAAARERNASTVDLLSLPGRLISVLDRVERRN